MTYSSSSKTFSGNTSSLTPGSYTIQGNLTDSSNNRSTWAFNLTVRDVIAPQLRITEQSINEGQTFTYTINERQDISNLRSGENYTIQITNNDNTGVTYSSSSKTFSGNTSSLTPGNYTIQGNLTDSSNNRSTWDFTLTVKDVTAPQLHITEQSINERQTFTYTINESQDISDLRSGENYTIQITDHDNTGVTYSSSSKTFSGNTSSLIPGTYTIQGRLTDDSNNRSTWDFTLTVKDVTAPQLRITEQSINEEQTFTYTINEGQDISNLRSGETYTIQITDHDNTGVTYNSSSKTFSGNTSSLAPGNYTIQGRLTDDSNNRSTWAFSLTVRDVIAPQLRIADQSIDERQSFSYTINEGQDISNLRSGETYTIQITDHDNTGVTYNSSSKTFSGNTSSLTPGNYTIQGRLTDDSNNRSTWAFTLTVKDVTAPQLRIADQEIEEGNTFSYTIRESDISHLRSGESHSITVVSNGGSGITYNEASQSFVSAQTLRRGTYAINGTIQDESSNRSNWSFNINVIAANVPPALNIALQRVEIGETFSYRIQDSDISGIASGEPVTIIIGSDGGSGVQLLNNNTFSRKTAFSQLASYTLAGTISDGRATSNWSFTLSVVDTRAPQLRIADQSINERQTFTYTINEGQDISDLRSGENYTIQITDHDNTGVTYSSSSKTFSGNTNSLAPGSYTIQGRITDNSNNRSTWAFSLTVRDVIAPQLRITEQSINEGQSFSYTINEGQDISDLRSGENYTIQITDHDNTGVTYSSSSKTFSGNTNSLAPGSYTIQGRITDNSNNRSTWAFSLTVRDVIAPQLRITEQSINEGQSFSYTINEGQDISNLRSGENYTIQITDHDNTGVTYSSSSKTFSGNTSSLAPGNYTIQGRLTDDSNNRSTWAFSLTVRDVIAPQLRIADQEIEEGNTFSYTIRGKRHLPSTKWGEPQHYSGLKWGKWNHL